MDEANDEELDEIDRESLVKDIEQIRRALGSASNTEPDARLDYDFDEYEHSGRGSDSEDSEDELAIIKSPKYRENVDEEKVLQKQRIPIDVISTEGEETDTDGGAPNKIQITSVQDKTFTDISSQLSEGVSYQISKVVPCENTDEVELTLTPINLTSQDAGDIQSQETQGMLIPGSSTYQAASTQYDVVSPEKHNNGYTLTELQPAKKDSISVNMESKDVCWSPVYDMNFSQTDSVCERYQRRDLGAAVGKSGDQSGTLDWHDNEVDYVGERSVWNRCLDSNLQYKSPRQRPQETGAGVEVEQLGNQPDILEGRDSDVDYVREESEVHCCLNLNRKYQAVIEEELRRIERSLLENKELQFGLKQMTQSSVTEAEALAFKQLTFFSKPYFKDKSKQGPPDNEDAKARKAIGQPSPFLKISKPWSKEESNILADAVKSAVLETKLTPLIQRIEVLSPRKSKTEEEEREIEQLKAEAEGIKGLPLPTLVENYAQPIDWDDISYKVLPSRTPFQCQIHWYNELHPLLNKDEWTINEDKRLLKLAKENKEEDWSKIACELKTNRSAVQCLQRYQKSLNKGFLKSKWEKEEDEKLIEAVKICGLGAWEKVSSLLEGRTGSQCMCRYMKSINPDIKKGKWDEKEDDLLRKGIEKYGSNWSKIRGMIPHRTDSQIRERWSDVLDPTINKGPWTEEEDAKLLKLVKEQGTGNWTKIASHMKGRNDNRCWRRWRTLAKNGSNLESLSTYVRKKTTAVSDVSRRPQDRLSARPEMSTNASNSSSQSSVSSSNSVITATSTSATVTTQATMSGTAAQLRPANVNKRVGRTCSGSSNVKKVAKSGRSDSSRLSGISQRNKPTTNLKTGPSTLSNSGEKTLAIGNPDSSRKQVPKKKVTQLNPTVIAQASALPNALPMTYLTQFSVLLQAFSVDVSGALKNVSSPEQQSSSQSDSDHTNVSTTVGSSNGRTAAFRSSSQVPQAGGASDENNSVVRRPTSNASMASQNKKRAVRRNRKNIPPRSTSLSQNAENVGAEDVTEGRASDEIRSPCRSEESPRNTCSTGSAQNVQQKDGRKGAGSNSGGRCISQNVVGVDEQEKTNGDSDDTSRLQRVADTSGQDRVNDVHGSVSRGVQISSGSEETTCNLSVNGHDELSNRDKRTSIASRELVSTEEIQISCLNTVGENALAKETQVVGQRRTDHYLHTANESNLMREVGLTDRPNADDGNDLRVCPKETNISGKKVTDNHVSNTSVSHNIVIIDEPGQTNCHACDLSASLENNNINLSHEVEVTSGQRTNNHDVSHSCGRQGEANVFVRDGKDQPLSGAHASQEVEVSCVAVDTNHNTSDKSDFQETTNVVTENDDVCRCDSSGERNFGQPQRNRRNEMGNNSIQTKRPVDDEGRGPSRYNMSIKREGSERDNGRAADPGVVLSDSRHGLTHEIVMSNSSTNEIPAETNVVQARCLTPERSKRKKKHASTIGRTNKRQRTVSRGSGRSRPTIASRKNQTINGQKSTNDNAENRTRVIGMQLDEGNIGSTESGKTSVDTVRSGDNNGASKPKRSKAESSDDQTRQGTPAKRYPVRSTRGRRRRDPEFIETDQHSRTDENSRREGSLACESAAEAPSISRSKSISRRQASEKNEHPTSNSSHGNRVIDTPCRIALAGNTSSVRAPVVPPLPPSATTLNAFKQLLILRKELQSRANSLKQTTTGTQSGTIRDGPSEKLSRTESPSGNAPGVTFVNNPIADRLLSDSCSADAYEFRDSLPYQQLLNRFQGLFLWPGFLSIVNPDFARRGTGCSETAKNTTTQRNQLASRKNT